MSTPNNYYAQPFSAWSIILAPRQSKPLKAGQKSLTVTNVSICSAVQSEEPSLVVARHGSITTELCLLLPTQSDNAVVWYHIDKGTEVVFKNEGPHHVELFGHYVAFVDPVSLLKKSVKPEDGGKSKSGGSKTKPNEHISNGTGKTAVKGGSLKPRRK
ncbi:hypothetical protein BDZ89DRAFT_1055467 [Hymenopellis radicata]|nr:hypothetical protein BDZ89DRAFT_1055467 [Hymenopellis radicata]